MNFCSSETNVGPDWERITIRSTERQIFFLKKCSFLFSFFFFFFFNHTPATPSAGWSFRFGSRDPGCNTQARVMSRASTEPCRGGRGEALGWKGLPTSCSRLPSQRLRLRSLHRAGPAVSALSRANTAPSSCWRGWWFPQKPPSCHRVRGWWFP